MKSREYRRLSGQGRRGGFLSLTVTTPRCSLWLGKDHVLAIESQGYREDYKRFYYRDIQAIVTRQTRRAFHQNLLIGALMLFLSALATVTGRVGWYVEGGLVALCGLLLLINLLRGPSCACQLRTAVNTEELPSLNRVRSARTAIERLRPLIEQAQGPMPAEPPADATPDAPPVVAATAVPVPPAKLSRPVRHESGRVHLALFALLLGKGFWTWLDFEVNAFAVTLGTTILTLGAGVLIIFALMRHHDSDLPAVLRRVVLATLGYVVVMLATGYLRYILVFTRHTPWPSNQWDMMRAAAAISPRDTPWLAGVYLFSIIAAFGLGTTGLVLLGRWWRQPRMPAVPPTIPPPATVGPGQE